MPKTEVQYIIILQKGIQCWHSGEVKEILEDQMKHKKPEDV